MKLFITGATGYIGWNIANTFRRAGYQVWGLTRSEEKAVRLEKNEIIPVVGSLQNPEIFEDIAFESDVIIHTAIDYQADSAALDIQTVDLFNDIAKSSPQPKTLVYTSGVWVYGNSKGQPLTEQSHVDPAQAFFWLPEVEQKVLNSKNTNSLVIRPGIVYGRGGDLTSRWFEGANNGSFIRVVGDGQNHWPMVHVDDLAQGYLKAVQSDLDGEIINLVDPTHNTVMEMASAAAKAAGNIRQIEFVPVDEAVKEIGELAKALALDQIVDATKAHRLLNWQPKHKGFIPEVNIYYRAWKASRSK